MILEKIEACIQPDNVILKHLFYIKRSSWFVLFVLYLYMEAFYTGTVKIILELYDWVKY